MEGRCIKFDTKIIETTILEGEFNAKTPKTTHHEALHENQNTK